MGPMREHCVGPRTVSFEIDRVFAIGLSLS